MLYTVEIAVDAANLSHELCRMRTWLDHMKLHAVGFRKTPGANVFRVGFNSEAEARAFARALAGKVLNGAAA